MISGKTQSGFEYAIEESALNDYEILELMAKIRKDDVFAIFELIEKLLGEEQKDRLKEHCRVDGRVPIEAMNAEIVDIFADAKVKKS